MSNRTVLDYAIDEFAKHSAPAGEAAARAELAALRARLASAEQAVNEARDIIALSHLIVEDGSLARRCAAWLAAHPAEQVTA